jgi:hypothetical protein
MTRAKVIQMPRPINPDFTPPPAVPRKAFVLSFLEAVITITIQLKSKAA